MDRSQKSCKKTCIMCYRSPENILVLACEHTVCLQCAYVKMNHRSTNSSNNDIEFSCVKCHEVTYFDKDLIKQIEASIQSESRKKNFEKDIEPKAVIYQKQKVHQGESFIEKMRNQYFSEKPLIPPVHQNTRMIQNHYQNFETKIKKSFMPQKQFSTNKNTETLQPYLYPHQSQTVYKRQPQNPITQKELKQKNSQQTKCKSHPYYELIYFCMNCRQVVCPQCLLRGQHKDHKNQSITEILEQELPDFISQASQKIYKQINQMQTKKEKHIHELNHKLSQIRAIRQNAQLYFTQVRKNLQKQEKQVLEKCDHLLNNLKKQQMENQLNEKQLQSLLSQNIQEIKSLKTFYQEFSAYEQCDTSRKGIQKSLIHKYLNCLKSVNSFLTSQKQENCVSLDHQMNHQSRNDQMGLSNESQMLNKRIQEGIRSIRQSLVFDNFSKPVNFVSRQDKKSPSQYQSRMTTKLEPYQERNEITKKLPHKKNQYISYVSTQNSHSKTKQIVTKSRQKSASISPYKGQISRQCIQLRKSLIPYKKTILRETTQLGKENVLIQQGLNDMKTELSTQNASGIKFQCRKDQKTRHNSKEKSRNSSVTKGKKRNSISYTNSIVNRFKA